MEDSREKSIKRIIESAKEEKENIIRYIDSIITYKLPEITGNSGRVTGLFTDIAGQLDISFSSDEQIKDLMALYTEKLIVLKQDLENLHITEEVLMGKESLLEQAQELVELIEPALEKAKDNYYATNRETLLKNYKQRQEIQSKITELNIQKAYLQGQLDITKRKKKKQELERKIKEIDDEIQDYEGKILNLKIQEKDISSPESEEQKTESMQPADNQIGEKNVHQGEEQEDEVNR